MSKLNENDQARIAAIEKYLGELYKYLPNPHLPAFMPISTEGLIYGFDTNPLGVDIKPPIAPVEPNTIAQTEWKPKVGEWVWIRVDNKQLYLIESLGGGTFKLNNQNGGVDWVGEEYIYFTKPTEEQVATHLTKIAEQRYKVGTTFIPPNNPNGTFITKKDDYYSYDEFGLYIPTLDGKWYVFYLNKWASILEVEPIKEERWNVGVGKNTDESHFVYIDKESDKPLLYKEANEIADKIKQILK